MCFSVGDHMQHEKLALVVHDIFAAVCVTFGSN